MDKFEKKISENPWLVGFATEFAFLQALAKSRTLQVMVAIAIVFAAIFFTFLVYYPK
ncbi:hypothetical protein GCM10017161_40150 [Thalassotalea marina]|uniref:Uncharacterized protein n=2 Tax=Thalassotalea marina TaxID=1673741 RepID=A0A919EQ21_9GAMM|nr:hypothetical protein GCM10017161_40150 [Thalassotalea marina]